MYITNKTCKGPKNVCKLSSFIEMEASFEFPFVLAHPMTTKIDRFSPLSAREKRKHCSFNTPFLYGASCHSGTCH